MPRLTVAYPKGPGVIGQAERVGWDWASKWMEELKEDGEGQPAERRRKLQSSIQTADGRLQHTSWSQTVRSVLPWYSLGPVGIVWLVCQLEALLHPSLSLLDVSCRLLLMCLPWIVLGGCIHALKWCLRPGHNKEEPPQRIQEEVVIENRNNQQLRVSQPRSPGLHIPLALALADSLMLCVLQEPLPDPSVPHIQALASRLKLVAHTLEKVGITSGMTLEEGDQGSILTDKLQLICTYLQQRRASLHTLVQVQGDFEASVKDILQGLDGLWAQLEKLHTWVTLTKEGSQGQVAVASAQTETVFTVLGHYRTKLQSCEANLKNSTQLLQELTWSHTHISNRVNSSSESFWPELLLQSNIEQFDKVQESFFAVEQQTSTFQTHLDGLETANQEGPVRPLAYANGAHPCMESPQTPPHIHNGRTNDVSPERRNSTSSSASISSVDAGKDTKTHNPISLRERSVLQLSSTIARLRKSGRKK